MDFRMIYSLLVGVAIGFTFLNLPPVLNTMMRLYDVSYAGISMLLSALVWSHALVQIPGGRLADRLGIKPSLYWSLGCLSLGNALCALAPSLALATVGRVLAGMGTGLSFIAAMKMVALYAPGGRVGAYQGYVGGFYAVGNIIAYLLLPAIGSWGWRWPYLIAAGMALAVALLTGALRLNRAADTAAPMPLGAMLRLPLPWIIGFFHALSWGTVINLGNWVPSILAEVLGKASVQELAWGGALTLAISGVGRLLGGFILLRVPAVRLANGSILILALTFLALFLARPLGLILALALVASWFASITFGAFFSIAGRAVPPQSIASVLGLVNLLANLGAVAFTLAFGGIKDLTGSFVWAWAMMALLAAGAFLLGRKVVAREMAGDQEPGSRGA